MFGAVVIKLKFRPYVHFWTWFRFGGVPEGDRAVHSAGAPLHGHRELYHGHGQGGRGQVNKSERVWSATSDLISSGHCLMFSVCYRPVGQSEEKKENLDAFDIATYCIKWEKTSWTYSYHRT